MASDSIPRLNDQEFKALVKTQAKGERSPALIAKGYTVESVEKASGELEGERRLQFTVSTGSVDRHDDTVNPNGCTNLKQFPKTGVVLWCHDSYLPPIGTPIKAWSEDGKVKSVAEFTSPDLDHPLGRGFGHTVYRYFVERVLKSVSIGFIPSEWEWSEDREWGIDFGKWEMLEFSPVPIPANKEAVVDLATKGLDMSGLIPWAEKCLSGGVSLIVPRKMIEDTHQSLVEIYGGQKTIVEVEPTKEVVETSEAETEPGIVFSCEEASTSTNYDGLVTAAGRVISAANEKRLRGAHLAIGEVLDQLGSDEEDDEEEEDKCCAHCQLKQEPSEPPDLSDDEIKEVIVETLTQGGVIESTVADTIDKYFKRLAGHVD
jgi:hypothetical protein